MRPSFLVLPLLVACGADSGSSPEPGRGVLLIAVDALRWDHTSFAGYDRDTTPKLLEWFAQNGLIFKDAWSPSPSLLPAHISLLTGCDPTVAQRPAVVLSDGSTLPPVTPWFVPPAVPTLAEEFLGAGWRTAAFVDHGFLEERRGVERGFREFEQVGGGRGEDWKPLMVGVGSRLVDWLGDLDSGEDWFAYVHHNDLEARWSERWKAHGPVLKPRYDPRPELDHLPPIALRRPSYFALPAERMLDGSPSLAEYEVHYDTALFWLDRNLRRLIGVLEERGQLENTTIVITGTYGVGFGEGGLLVDSGTLAPVDLRVPLLLRPAPGLAADLGLGAKRELEQLVGLADVAPTLLALHGLPLPSGMQGANLASLLRGDDAPVHQTLFASHSITAGFSVVTEEHHYAWWNPYEPGRGSPPAQSWYGSKRRIEGDGVRVLVTRETPAADWLAGEVGAADPAGAALHARGTDWYAQLARAREVLHPNSWNAHARGPEVVADLRSRGLIGDRP